MCRHGMEHKAPADPLIKFPHYISRGGPLMRLDQTGELLDIGVDHTTPPSLRREDQRNILNTIGTTHGRRMLMPGCNLGVPYQRGLGVGHVPSAAMPRATCADDLNVKCDAPRGSQGLRRRRRVTGEAHQYICRSPELEVQGGVVEEASPL